MHGTDAGAEPGTTTFQGPCAQQSPGPPVFPSPQQCTCLHEMLHASAQLAFIQPVWMRGCAAGEAVPPSPAVPAKLASMQIGLTEIPPAQTSTPNCRLVSARAPAASASTSRKKSPRSEAAAAKARRVPGHGRA